MKITVIGSGTSFGVPVIGCPCAVCHSHDPKDHRTRASIIVESDIGTRILIDCGPDFRQQMLTLQDNGQPFRLFDAVLLTHIHYDHVGGLDDLRPFTLFSQQDLDIYAQQDVIDQLHHSMPYCFKKVLYPGVPRFAFHEIKAHDAFRVGDMDIVPIRVMHGKLPILGFRIGKFAYLTDMKYVDDAELPLLEGVDTVILGALRFEKEHHSHQLIPDAIEFGHRIGARRIYITHLTHDIGFHPEAQSRLPQNTFLCFDGQEILV